MTSLIVESTRNPNLYAALGPTEAGEVLVRIFRRSGWVPGRRGEANQPVERLLGMLVVDAPFHLVADRVHDLINSMNGGEKK